MTRLFALAAFAAALGLAPALGAQSHHGVPPEALAQAWAAPAPDVYLQWNYTGWSGLTKHWDDQAHPNGQWATRSERYIAANPPR